MAYYLMQPTPVGYAMALQPPPLLQPQPTPDLEFLSISESDAISQILVDRNVELRLEGLVHVFLPKKTPQKTQPDLELVEASILTYLVHCTEDVLNAYHRDFDWKTTFALKEWRRLQLLMEHGTDVVFTTSLSNALFNLPTGQRLPLYIRKQNCGIIFTKTDQSHSSFKIETFQASLPSEQVMSTVGPISVEYPHTVDFTENAQLLCSTCFLQQIRDLALNEYEASMPKVKKGGQDFAENRDVPKPILITELLLGMLANGEDHQPEIEKELKITKKVRDQVEWHSCPTPFRRSGLWTSAKVNLHLCLLQEVGDKDAKMVYKMILLRMICGLVNFRADTSPSDWDLMHQMLAKLTLRCNKFSGMTASNETLKDLQQNILKDAYRTVHSIQSKMTFLWTELSTQADCLNVIDRSSKEFQGDLNHEARLLEEYLETPMVPIQEEEHDGVADIVAITRCITLEKLIKAETNLFKQSKTDENLDQEVIWLHDVEKLDLRGLGGNVSAKLYNLMVKYAERGVKRYSRCHHHDPVSFSRLVITLLRLYKKLDEIATEIYPLLSQYSAGIDCSFFQKLLGADGPKDLAVLDNLEKYFKKRHEIAKYNSIIYQSTLGQNSFSVRFAQQSKGMERLREEILKDTEVAVEKKMGEVARVKRECEAMEKQIHAMEHDYNELTGQHLKDCKRCSQMKTWNRKKLSVRIFERRLPREPLLQQALVFELMVPVEISVVRDALALITKEVLGSEAGIMDGSKISTNWISGYYPMKDYIRKCVKYSELVQLGSPAKPFSASHYNKLQDVFVVPAEEFVVENGMTCYLFHVRKLKDFKTPGDPYAFQISGTSDEKLYKNLQFAISGTEHTQNKVLAEQHLFSGSLPPSEVIAFGSLRSGHRIQLRNLYKFLSEKSLNIEREPVLALILQTLWTAGPLEANSREEESEFTNKPFAQEFLVLLENVINANSHNWSSPLTLLVPVAITLQFLKFTSSKDVRNTCATLLRKCRGILEGWVTTVQDQLSLVPAQDPVQKENEQLFLKARILEMLITAAFTFHGGTVTCAQDHGPVEYLIQTKEDMLSYLKTLSGLHYYVNVEKIQEKLTPFMTLLLQMARQRIPLNLETHAHYKIKSLGTPGTLDQFVRSNWIKYSGPEMKSCSWKLMNAPDKLHVYEGRLQFLIGHRPKIHVDIIGGVFLIDHFPPSLIPASISHDPLFQRHFGTQYGENFKVQRDATTFTTVNPINGRHYTFFQARYNANPICICRELLPQNGESRDNGPDFLELLNPEMFRGVVASPFIENYTHWLNPQTNEVYFRKRGKRCLESAAGWETEPDYKLCRNSNDDEKVTWKLINCSEGKYLMYLASPGFRIFCEILSRLEEWRFINILVNPEESSEEPAVTAKLPRLGLNFYLEAGHLHSVEYPGYYVALNQSKGTLVGLRHALLLEKETDAEIDGKKKLILVPHGVLGNDKQFQVHHTTVIRADDVLRQPPFFVYEVDPVLKRLTADKSKAAWLYLSILHGATASPLPDPFTGLTGTEMALWILQSALVWSCSPYDFECKKTLQMIRSLSPPREYYPQSHQHMEQVTWLPTFSSYASYDGYDIIVQKLIEDSERLQDLFPPQKTSGLDAGLHQRYNEVLRIRGYLRHRHIYNPCALLHEKNIPDLFLNHTPKKQVVQKINVRKSDPLSALQEISLVRSNSSQCPTFSFAPPHADLDLFLITKEHILGENNCLDVVYGTMRNWMLLNLRQDWMRLYNLALSADNQNLQNPLTMILCTMAYHQKASRSQLLNLHFISRFASRKSFPFPLYSVEPYKPTNHQFRGDMITDLLRKTAQPFSGMVPLASSASSANSLSRGGKETKHLAQQEIYNLYLTAHNKGVADEVTELANGILHLSMSPTFSVATLNQYFLNYMHMSAGKSRIFPLAVITEVFYLIGEWHRNLEFKNFVLRAQQQLKTIYDEIRRADKFSPLELMVSEVNANVTVDLVPPLTDNLAEFFNPEKMSCKSVPALIYATGRLNVDPEVINNPVEHRTTLVSMGDAILEELRQSLLATELAKCLDTCGLYPRLVPINLLRKLVTEKDSLPDPILDHIGGIAVLQTHIRRLNRLIKYEDEGPQMATELERERENRGHENWSPKQIPEWLLLELDLDLMIRPIQVEVAQQMSAMPDGGNGVMQLNMGEGKTSLIVPMLVSTLATQDTLCRVTVLNSIFQTNLGILSHAIGGLLNRKVYTVPCRRDAKIRDSLDKIWQVYRECLENQGAILTLAEYRLSPRLMTYEKLLGTNDDTVSFGLDLLELEDWLRLHCRDILDESDELLSAKYQLIYTTGSQLPLGGGTMRWLTCQNILALVPEVLRKLWIMYGDRMVEFEASKWENFPEQFPPCRLLTNQIQEDFNNFMAEEILGGKSGLIDIILSKEDYSVTKRFLTEIEIGKEVHDKVLEIFKDDADRLDKILLISGYLRRGILQLALSKRWRVEYGVDRKGRRQMAVPFRAKDVAAERTEFGHPDVGIVLTHLSYYFSGLQDDQLIESFAVLKSAPGPESIYHEWIMDIPKERVDPSIRSYEGVNLRDFKQRTVHLFPLLRKNKRVIDFWLSNKVFPKESKQFPRKIVTTAFDLVHERNSHPTTGFSGTNDCSILLPLPIKQQDLPQLEQTNREMEEILRRPENSKTVSLSMSTSCREILQRMRADGARVLIDAGALMLELGNEQVARLWLETDSGIEGVVYFNDKNELLVKVRASHNFAGSSTSRRRRRVPFTAADIPLEVSPYRERLDKCAIFLDDQHTRGTDLKFPNGFKGCVTVGSRMKRDKLIQAGMRMRKLGKGHSLTFYLSQEVTNKIQEMPDFCWEKSRKNGIVTGDILKWVASNSQDFEKEGLIFWAMAGKNYAQKLAAEDMFQETMDLYPSCSFGRRLKFAKLLGDHCVDEECVDLREMYGTHLKHENLVQLLVKWFALRKEKLEENVPLNETVNRVYDAIQEAVVGRCHEYIPERLFLANNFEEEQEKELELEPEHEEIRCVRRYKAVKAWEPSLHPEVREFAVSGKMGSLGKWPLTSPMVRLSDIFAHTTFAGGLQPESWKCDIFATGDFVKVIHPQRKTMRDKLDNYLRPISYILLLHETQDHPAYLLLISPHEANELFPEFKSGQVHALVKLHMFSARCFLGQDVLLNNPHLQLPVASSPHIIENGMIAPLLLASGSLFFGSMEEQTAYAKWLGFIPRPWTTAANQEAVNLGWILKTGFLLPQFANEYRQLVQMYREREADCDKENDEETDDFTEDSEDEQLVNSELNFQEDPSSMVKAILENRHVSLRESAHVIQLLSKCAYVSMDSVTNGDDDQDEMIEDVLAKLASLLNLEGKVED